MIDDEYGVVGGMRIGRGNWSTRRKLVPMPLCPLQTPHDVEPGRPMWEADQPPELWHCQIMHVNMLYSKSYISTRRHFLRHASFPKSHYCFWWDSESDRSVMAKPESCLNASVSTGESDVPADILNFGTRRRWVVSIKPCHITLGGRVPGFHWTGNLVRSGTGVAPVAEGRI
jgi:hypothetical protein